MKYEDLILISDPYTVYTKFKKIYPSDSEIKISTRETKKYMIYDPNIKKWFILVILWKIILFIKIYKED